MLRRLISKHFHSYSAQESATMCVFSRGKAVPAVVALHRPGVKMLIRRPPSHSDVARLHAAGSIPCPFLLRSPRCRPLTRTTPILFWPVPEEPGRALGRLP